MSPRALRAGRAVALAATVVVPAALAGEQIARSPLAATLVAVLLAAGLAVRRRPVFALTSVTTATFVATITDQGVWPLLAVIVVAYLSGRVRPAGWTIWALTVAIVVTLLAVWLARLPLVDPFLLLLTLVGSIVVPWWIGSDVRVRDELVHAGWNRAAQLEREQRLVITAARHEERARLAAEMHDALGYELSVLALTAGAGEVDPTNTPAQRAQFARARAAAVHAVESLHEVLALLRADESHEEIAPGALDALIERYRASGAKIDARLDVDPSVWPPVVRRATYRIVQELLANAAKHATGHPLRIEVASSGTSVTIHSRNPRIPRTITAPGSRSGLLGVAERAHALGGHATTSEDTQSFDVFVSIPLTPIRASGRNEPVTDAGTLSGVSVHAGDMAASPRPSLVVRRWQVAAVPVVALALVLSTLLALNAITAERIGLPGETFDEMAIGMSLTELEPKLPPAHLNELPPAFANTAALPGAACRYYRGSDSWLALGDSYFQLCFTNDVLTSKERIP